jgi:tyrosine-protein kinase Etk/Wzc
VDGDLRRGRLHHAFGLARRPGLADFLAGPVAGNALFRDTPVDRLQLLACGVRSKTAPELLASSPKLGQILAHVRTGFDAVIIDTPPLGVGIDPAVFAAATGNLLLVLRARSTNRGLAAEKLHQLSRLPIRILGAVLNDVPHTDAYLYYHYSYYPEYEPEDEATPTHRQRLLGA